MNNKKPQKFTKDKNYTPQVEEESKSEEKDVLTAEKFIDDNDMEKGTTAGKAKRADFFSHQKNSSVNSVYPMNQIDLDEVEREIGSQVGFDD